MKRTSLDREFSRDSIHTLISGEKRDFIKNFVSANLLQNL